MLRPDPQFFWVEGGTRGTTPNYISVRILDGDFKIGDEVQVEIRDVVCEEALGLLAPQ